MHTSLQLQQQNYIILYNRNFCATVFSLKLETYQIRQYIIITLYENYKKYFGFLKLVKQGGTLKGRI